MIGWLDRVSRQQDDGSIVLHAHVIGGFHVVSGTSSTGVKTTGYEMHLSFMVRGNSVGTSYPRPEPPILPQWCDNDGLGKSSASLKMEGGQNGPPWEG